MARTASMRWRGWRVRQPGARFPARVPSGNAKRNTGNRERAAQLAVSASLKPSKPPSPKQLAFIRDLSEQLSCDVAPPETSRGASATIRGLLHRRDTQRRTEGGS